MLISPLKSLSPIGSSGSRSWTPDFIVLLGDKTGDYQATASDGINAIIRDTVKPQMILGIGDYEDPTAPTQAQSMSGLESFTKYSDPGNHDRMFDGTRNGFNAMWNGGGYRKVSGHNVDFFLFDVNLKQDESGYWSDLSTIAAITESQFKNSIQGKWIIAQLAASTAKWKVVLIHIPISNVWSSTNGSVVPGLAWDWKGYGADVIINGHTHFYERLSINCGNINIPIVNIGNSGSLSDTPGNAVAGSILIKTYVNPINDNAFTAGMLTTLTASQTALSIKLYGVNNALAVSALKDELALTWVAPPAAPANLACSLVGNDIKLDWTDMSAGALAFAIDRTLYSDNTGWSQVYVTAAGAVTYTNTGLLSNSTYYYRVRSFDTHKYSVPSNLANTTTPTAVSTLLTGISAYYKLNEASGNVVDQVAANNGTVSGGTYSATGKVGTAISFAGTGGITLPSTSAVTFGTGNVSFNIWCYLTSLAGAGINTALFAGATNAFALVVQGADRSLRCQKIGVAASGQSTTLLALNTWQMVTITLDGTSHNLIFYINGTPAGTVSFNQNFTGASNFIASGTGMTTPTGTIDEVGVWLKVLSTDEITALYRAGIGNTYPF
jgi:hypothetical protein